MTPVAREELVNAPPPSKSFLLLRLDGTDVTERPYSERRELLESFDLNSAWWRTADTFADGASLFSEVCAMGLEAVVAKRVTSRYGVNARGCVKVKNPTIGDGHGA